MIDLRSGICGLLRRQCRRRTEASVGVLLNVKNSASEAVNERQKKRLNATKPGLMIWLGTGSCGGEMDREKRSEINRCSAIRAPSRFQSKTVAPSAPSHQGFSRVDFPVLVGQPPGSGAAQGCPGMPRPAALGVFLIRNTRNSVMSPARAAKLTRRPCQFSKSDRALLHLWALAMQGSHAKPALPTMRRMRK